MSKQFLRHTGPLTMQLVTYLYKSTALVVQACVSMLCVMQNTH